jgi:hypothetical protein
VPPAAWNPKIEKRSHPFGEQGVRSSLEEVAKKATEGGNHPRVKEWAGELIHDARLRGVPVKGDRARAEILLTSVQRFKTWVPDPVGTEYIKGAHLLACGKDDKYGPCFNTDDCDGLVVLIAASFLSVGIHTAIIGHAYNAERNIQHVLAAARIKGEWLYADPSYDFPLGKCEPFTRERMLSVPNIKVVCDETACLTNPTSFDPEREGFVSHGMYVGVDGVPERVREIWWLGPARKT